MLSLTACCWQELPVQISIWFLAVRFERLKTQKIWYVVLTFNEKPFCPHDGRTSQICSISDISENTEQKYRKPSEEMELFISRSAARSGLHETQMDDSRTCHQLLWGKIHPLNSDLLFEIYISNAWNGILTVFIFSFRAIDTVFHTLKWR